MFFCKMVLWYCGIALTSCPTSGLAVFFRFFATDVVLRIRKESPRWHAGTQAHSAISIMNVIRRGELSPPRPLQRRGVAAPSSPSGFVVGLVVLVVLMSFYLDVPVVLMSEKS